RNNQLRAENAELSNQLAVLQSHIRTEATTAQAASMVEIRQARIDGAAIATDLLAEVERWSVRHPQLGAVLEALEAVAAQHRIHRLEHPGAVVPFDPRIHRVVTGDPSPLVFVVESGWAIVVGGDPVTTRYAVVRPVAADREGTE